MQLERRIPFTGEEAVAGTLLEKLSTSSAFVNLLHQVYEQGSSHAAQDKTARLWLLQVNQG